MNANPWHEFEQLVTCDARWHADSEPLPWPPPAALLQALTERNAATLATIAALEERRADTSDDDNPVVQELARLDAKLTALVDIVDRLVLPDSQLPPRRPIRFNALGAVAPAELAPADGGWLLRLRFDVCRSVPLELPGYVARRFDDGHVFLAFHTLGESVAASLERLVFRQHRRKVAVARQSAP
jgi:hypothetical protein